MNHVWLIETRYVGKDKDWAPDYQVLSYTRKMGRALLDKLWSNELAYRNTYPSWANREYRLVKYVSSKALECC